MTQVVISPEWFASTDMILLGFSVITLLLIAAFSLRFYFFKKKEHKNYLYFAISFLLLAISFLWKIATDITVYYDIINTKQAGIFTITYQTMRAEKVLFVAGHFAHYLFALLGLYLLYVVLNRKSTMNHLLILYFIVMTTIFSNFSYFIFHLTAFVLLLGISYRYYLVCKQNKRNLTKLIFTSFSIIAVSQILFMFVKLWGNIYVAAQIIQLIGFILLLVAFISVLKNGKKKSNKYHKRHA
jgi:hypothetical protein